MLQLKQFIGQFTDISDIAFNAFSEIITEKEVQKNEILIQQDKVCNHLYFINKGLARSFYYKEEKEITNWFATDGHFLTSFYSFVSRKPSYENVQLLENTSMYVIHYDSLQKLFRQYHEIERIGRLITEYYYQWQEERIISLQFLSAKEKYNRLLENEPYIIQKAPLGMVASYLGITQETLSRIRAI